MISGDLNVVALVLGAAGTLLMFALTVAVGASAWFLRSLHSSVDDLRKEVTELRVAVQGVATNRVAVEDHEQRLRVLEHKGRSS